MYSCSYKMSTCGFICKICSICLEPTLEKRYFLEGTKKNMITKDLRLWQAREYEHLPSLAGRRLYLTLFSLYEVIMPPGSYCTKIHIYLTCMSPLHIRTISFWKLSRTGLSLLLFFSQLWNQCDIIHTKHPLLKHFIYVYNNSHAILYPLLL